MMNIKYRYNYLSERYHKMNCFYVIAACLIWAMYLVYGLPSHILYERQLEDYLKEEAVFSKKSELAMPFAATIRYLREHHKKYLKKAGNFETDCYYIYEAAQAVSSCLLRAIAVNEQESKEAEEIPTYALPDYHKAR